MLTLSLQKPGQAVQKLQLNLTKNGKFTVEMSWTSDSDPDVHALLAYNDGSRGAKVTSFAQVLSTYNSKKTNAAGALDTNPDGSFSTPCGSLRHSGDARSGMQPGVNEVITVDATKIPASVNEIPVFITIHPPEEKHTFAEVTKCKITIRDDASKVLAEAVLDKEFALFNAVQMGSFLRGDKGWEYAVVGGGFNGDFNSVLATFS